MIHRKIKINPENEKVELTTYVYDPELEMINHKKRPAVLVLGGGGYFVISDSESEPVAMAFNAMGYHAFTLKYSVYGADAFAYDMQNLEKREMTEYPAPLRDVARAILYIKDHAEEWHIDSDRIAVCGFSAGAHNAALYVTSWNKPVITDFFNRPAEEFRPAAGILCYALSDFTYLKKALEKGEIDADFFMGTATAYLGDRWKNDEVLDEVSPTLQVTEQTAPCFIWTTTEDKMVQPQQSLLMALALQDAHIPYELHVFEEGDHGLSLANTASAATKAHINDHVHKWVGLCETWLLKRFAIEMPEAMNIDDFAKDKANIMVEK